MRGKKQLFYDDFWMVYLNALSMFIHPSITACYDIARNGDNIPSLSTLRRQVKMIPSELLEYAREFLKGKITTLDIQREADLHKLLGDKVVEHIHLYGEIAGSLHTVPHTNSPLSTTVCLNREA